MNRPTLAPLGRAMLGHSKKGLMHRDFKLIPWLAVKILTAALRGHTATSQKVHQNLWDLMKFFITFQFHREPIWPQRTHLC